MDYNLEKDLFNKEPHISLDRDGTPITSEDHYEMEMGLDVPGSDEDNNMEKIGLEEENNYWNLNDNEDDHEEENIDIAD